MPERRQKQLQLNLQGLNEFDCPYGMMPLSQHGVKPCMPMRNVQQTDSIMINTAWFVEQLERRKISQRKLAKLMAVDPSAVSLMFRGQRKITLDEAAQMAVLLDVTPTEILVNAGVKVAPSNTSVKLIGYATDDHSVVLFGEGNHELTDGPANLPSTAVCIRCQMSSPAEFMDGWLLFANDTSGRPEQAIDTLALCAIKGNGLKVARIKRGYRKGAFNLSMSSGSVQNVELAWASPIIWIKTTA